MEVFPSPFEGNLANILKNGMGDHSLDREPIPERFD